MGLLFRIFTAGLNQNCNSEKCLNHYWKNAVFFFYVVFVFGYNTSDGKSSS
jgi:hypothetical protein